VAAGLLMNFAAWGTNCGRMSRALRDRYGLTDQATAFFDLFAAPPGEFESQAMTVVAGGLARGAEPRLVKRAARLLQGFEKTLLGHAPRSRARVGRHAPARIYLSPAVRGVARA